MMAYPPCALTTCTPTYLYIYVCTSLSDTNINGLTLWETRKWDSVFLPHPAIVYINVNIKNDLFLSSFVICPTCIAFRVSNGTVG